MTRRGVDAVEVAGVILQAMVRLGGRARLKDIVEATDLAAAKIHRYLVSLQTIGLIQKSMEGNVYELGLLSYQIGQLAVHESDLVNMVAPIVAEFAQDAGETCGVAMWLNQGATVVRWFGVHHEISIMLRPGTTVTLTASSTGSVFGAYLPRQVTEPLVREELKQAGAASPAKLSAMYKHFAEVRGNGIAHSHGSRVAWINTLSAPVFDRDGNIAMAITMLGHQSTFSAAYESPVANSLKALGARLTAMMGGKAPEEEVRR